MYDKYFSFAAKMNHQQHFFPLSWDAQEFQQSSSFWDKHLNFSDDDNIYYMLAAEKWTFHLYV